jgi:protease-4
MVKKIARAREDENVKAVVLRVNSPGGSALASDVMWHELMRLKAEKPIIVSMGNYAASGGYYISCMADAIYADNTTLTGSIGVYGLMMNFGGALRDKLGVNVDVVKTNAYSDLGTPFHTPTDVEKAHLQRSVEEIYATFVGNVAAGRNMTPESVDKIGQGRVWAGANALEIGLIDGFGGLTDAITLAANRVGVADDFRVWEVSDAPTGLAAMFSGFSTGVRSAVRDYVMRDELGASFAAYDHLRHVLDDDPVQARLTHNIELR